MWASGGAFSDFLIHNIDECCWMKDAWPVKAKGFGGRHYRGNYIDQNFDTYSVEYTFADGAKLMLEGRTVEGCYPEFASYAHGIEGIGRDLDGRPFAGPLPHLSGPEDGQRRSGLAVEQPEPNPYQLEWDHLIQAIREDKPYNECRRGAEASLVTSMGRMACHTGQVVTYDQMLAHDHEFAPDIDKLTMNSPAPLLAGSDGKYPVPQPGLNKTREY